MRPPPARITNARLLLALVLTFGTGLGAVANGSGGGRWVVIAHGATGLLLLFLTPAKRRVARAGLEQRRRGAWASLLLAVLVLAALALGVLHSTGLVRSVGGHLTLWLHIAVALAAAPLVLWHTLARRVRVRRTDLQRRHVLQLGVLATAAVATYTAAAGAVHAAGLPGADRRFTGSHRVAPHAMPRTVWLDDRTPRIDAAAWRLAVRDGSGERHLDLDELRSHRVDRMEILDCTSGWFAEQTWTGAPLATLLLDVPTGTRSIRVRSTTGYEVLLPVEDLESLMLATAMGGVDLSPGHGWPARLVAPGRRGFWWVKWVERIDLTTTPAWQQSPFPLT